ncbi:MAG: hypothetical protein RLN88_08500 [Ekhidna sp.]|uniref:hypothetical protein n=1 Tax=Ekhidna sp. TaxID=2608089 RepID=UPI0032F004A2
MTHLKTFLAFISIFILLTLAGCAEEVNCCKKCSVGKACGDSCIDQDIDCNEGPGCACDV